MNEANIRIAALLFEFEPSNPSHSLYLIAWLDQNGNSQWCKHTHPGKVAGF